MARKFIFIANADVASLNDELSKYEYHFQSRSRAFTGKFIRFRENQNKLIESLFGSRQPAPWKNFQQPPQSWKIKRRKPIKTHFPILEIVLNNLFIVFWCSFYHLKLFCSDFLSFLFSHCMNNFSHNNILFCSKFYAIVSSSTLTVFISWILDFSLSFGVFVKSSLLFCCASSSAQTRVKLIQHICLLGNRMRMKYIYYNFLPFLFNIVSIDTFNC